MLKWVSGKFGFNSYTRAFLATTFLLLYLVQSKGQSSFAEVIEKLSSDYDISFAYNHDQFLEKKIELVKGESLRDVLDQLASDYGLSYKIKGDLVLIRPLELDESRYYTVSGVVMDQSTNKPMSLANVYLAGTTYGTVTDQFGQFSLRAKASPSDQFLVQISYVGYDPVEFVVMPQASVNLNIELKANESLIENVIIEQRSSSISLNPYSHAISQSLDSSKLSITNNVTQDVFRGLQLFPGINASNDLSSRISIRGGDADESLIIFDGMTLFRTDHIYSIFSSLNANTLGSVGLYKNAFPAEYGGRTSGVVEVDSKSINDTGLKATVGTLTSDIMGTVAVSPTFGLMVAGRTTSRDLGGLDVFDALDQRTSLVTNEDLDTDEVLLTSQIQPNVSFYDLFAKAEWLINPKHQLQLNAFKSYDNYNYSAERNFEVENQNDQEIDVRQIYAEDTDWKNLGLSLNYLYKLKDGKRLSASIAYTDFEEEIDFKIVNSTILRNGVSRPLNENEDVAVNGITSQQAKFMFESQINLRTLYNLGYEFKSYDVNPLFESKRIDRLNQPKEEDIHSIFGQLEHHFDFGLYTNIGLRLNHYESGDNDYQLSPRLLLGYDLTDGINISASYGRYFQYLQEADIQAQYGRSVELWLLTNQELAGQKRVPLSESDHWSVGMNWINDLFTFNIDFYHKKTTGVSRSVLLDYRHPSNSSSSNSRPRHELIFGDQYVRGIDVLVKKDIKNYSTWMFYTLSENKVQYDALNQGEKFFSEDDSRHQFKWVQEWSPKKRLSLQSTFVYSSGRAYTDLENNLRESESEPVSILALNQYQNRLPDYHRFDIGVNYDFKLGLSNCRIGAQVFNVFDRQNVLYREYLYMYRQRGSSDEVVFGTEINQLGRTPQINFSIDF